MPDHNDIPRGERSAHPLGYIQQSDPGAVGAFKPWWVTNSDSTPTTLTDFKLRNADDSAWISLVTGIIVAAPVTSVFGRTGVVVAAEGDYTLTQLAGVTITSAVGGHLLAFDGASWVNRVLVAGDIPSLDAAIITSGQFAVAQLAVGTPDGTQFIRDDGTLAVPSGTGAPTTVDYLVKTASGSLSAERVVTDGTSITADWSAAGLVTFIRAALTGDVTASADSNVTTIKNDVALAGNPTTTTQAAGNNTTRIATTAFVKAAIDAVLGGVSAAFDTLSEIATELALKAPLASPTFTGTPTLPTGTIAVTQSQGDNSTKPATTAYVDTAAAGLAPVNAQYLVLAANGTLTVERVLTLAARLSGTDAGAGSTYTVDLTNNMRDVAIPFIIDGGGSAITTGLKGDIEIPFSGTIVSVRLFSQTSGSIVLDLWKDTYANYPPTIADTITASAKPTLSSAQKSQDTTLTGWTTSVTAGDIISWNVDSATTVTRVLGSLVIRRS